MSFSRNFSHHFLTCFFYHVLFKIRASQFKILLPLPYCSSEMLELSLPAFFLDYLAAIPVSLKLKGKCMDQYAMLGGFHKILRVIGGVTV